MIVHRFLRPLSLGGLLSIAVACAQTSSPAPVAAPAAAQETPAPPTRPLPQPALFEPGESGGPVSVPDIVSRALPSVVNIASTRTRKVAPFTDPFHRFFFGPQGPERPEEREEHGMGSGVVVADGVVLTNNHVVEEADDITVTTADGHELKATVAGTDPKSDLAVLKLEGDTGELHPIAWGDSSALRLGDTVLAIGNPFGVGRTVTMGIVSALGRADLGIVDYEDFIQTDAAINPGNSGGALVNTRGELIGINTAILSRSGGSMGIGFAIPEKMARPIMEALLRDGRVVRGWLGIGIQTIDAELAQALQLPAARGVLVSDVAEDTPAARGGLERGDVVLRVEGQEVNSTGELRNLVASAGAGHLVKLDVLRDGKPVTVSVKLGEMPLAEGKSGGPAEADGRVTEPEKVAGLQLQPPTPQLRRKLQIPADLDHGLVVTRVERATPAGRAGVRPGDVLLEVNREPVRSVSDFRKLWKAAGKTALLLVLRDGRTAYLVAKP